MRLSSPRVTPFWQLMLLPFIILLLSGCDSDNKSQSPTSRVLTDIQIQPQSVRKGVAQYAFPAGLERQLRAIGIYNDNSTADITDSVTWTSSVPEVSAVSQAGLVETLSPGSSIIGARQGAIVASHPLPLVVNAATLESIQVTPATLSLHTGAQHDVVATGHYSDGMSYDLTTSAQWSSSATSVATVGEDGRVVAMAPGQSEIIATHRGVASPVVPLWVRDTALSTLRISASQLTMALGHRQQLMAQGYYEDGSQADLTRAVNWHSSNGAALSIDAEGGATAIEPGGSLVTASLDGVSSNSLELSIGAATLSAITVTPTLGALKSGETRQFAAIGVYSDGDRVDLSGEVSWSSSEQSVLVVDKHGLAQAVKAGSSLVRASKDGVVSDAVTVVVLPAELTGITLTPANTQLRVGGAQQFTATGHYDDGSSVNLSSSVTWQSDEPGIATVDPTGLVSAVAVGQTAIRAMVGGLSSPAVQVDVTEVALSTIHISAPTLAMYPGAKQQLTATALYADATQVDVTQTVSWHSSEGTVVSVGIDGVATALSAGDTQVSASLSGVTSHPLMLQVEAVTLSSIEIAPLSADLRLNEAKQFVATGVYSDGGRLDLSTQVDWSSSDPSVLTIDPSGLALAVKAGSSQVKASKDGVQSNSVMANVLPARLSGLVLTPTDAQLFVGGSLQLQAMGHYDDGSEAVLASQLLWQSDDPSVATVDAGGKVSGVVAGTARITASLAGVNSNAVGVTINTPPILIEPTQNQLGIMQVSPAQFAFWNSTGINTPEGQTAIKALGQTVYAQFKDEFDFITVVMNNAAAPAGMPTGEYSHVKNDVQGLGLSMFDHTAEYGSGGKLQGVYFLYRSRYLSTSSYGPILHEMLHRWANWVVPSSYSGHWGSELGITGQLNSVSSNFAEIELYLMGLMAASEMTDPASINAYNLIPATQKVRVPDVATAQKSFRSLLLVVTDRALTIDEINGYNGGATLLTRIDNPTQAGTNFHKMTGGRGTLFVGGLAQLVK